MDLGAVLGLLKYLFMGIFIIFFVMDLKSKTSYKIHYYISLTVAIIFATLGWNWTIEFKIGFIILIVLLTLKTIFDEKKRWSENDKALT
ncbi:hypothetical protein ACFSFY_06255 [Sporosarcina siberiensis]|uniref:YlaH-like protein n=1 Tax=Sporosarcina siberiensis TaxID=1365606 RepID=A0ABW4SDV0_9BACL